MSDISELLARAIFVGADDSHNTWPSPAHAECQKMVRNCLAALDAAGFEIVPKVRCSLCGGLGITDSGECPDCPDAAAQR